ncbi:helix-turn-helix domain-containing protein [Metarhizobium album]|uniref:helix-turn-helix domain-containing protein n=1 Tax=Metarhizobium album TaxID=2182425 RepID=UPI001FE01855|nr:helix-turn-helix domain-containing protein [Rhizobium album]
MAAVVNYDLFGDVVPEGLGKRGRPPHVVNDARRAKVMLLMAIGRKNSEIAAALGISEPTLRKSYRAEMRSREEARFRVEGENLLKLFEQVHEGNVAAIKEMRKVLDKAEAGDGEFYKRAAANATNTKAPKEKKLGKKEQELKDAIEMSDDTPLGRLMNQRANPDRMN